MAVLTINTCGGQCRGIWEVETRHAIRQPTVHRMPPSDPQVHVGVRNPCHCRGLFTQATVTPDIRGVSAPTPGTARQSRPGSAVILLPHLGSLANPRALDPLPESPATLKRGFCPSWEPAPSLTGGIWGDAPVVTGVSPRPLGPPAALLGAPGGSPSPSRRIPARPPAPHRAERWAAPLPAGSFRDRCGRLFTGTSHLNCCSGRRRNPRASCISRQPLQDGEGRGACPRIH